MDPWIVKRFEVGRDISIEQLLRSHHGVVHAAGAATDRKLAVDQLPPKGMLLIPPDATTPLFESLETDWVALDCELLPWSAKAVAVVVTSAFYIASFAGARGLLEALQRFGMRGFEMVQRMISAMSSRMGSCADSCESASSTTS